MARPLSTRTAERLRRLLCSLQDDILGHLTQARATGRRDFARVSAVTASDIIYRVDRISEAAIDAWLEQHWPKAWPVELVMEGRDPGETYPRGLPWTATLFKLIIDPIDGTRNLMYDKRSAWTLAGVSPQSGPGGTVADIAVAAMTELPTSKQDRADQLSAIRGAGPRGVVAQSIQLGATGRRRPLRVRPSGATDCRGGFASIVRFFPEAKGLLGEFEEALWRRLYTGKSAGSSLVFEDQYLSTGGQIHELLCGHDRMIADLRPLAYRRLGLADALTCHPYDICTALILQEAGGLVEDPFGRPLRVPLDAVSPVAWVGYANPRLARRIRPVLGRLVREFF